jgi:hypothetical protein
MHPIQAQHARRDNARCRHTQHAHSAYAVTNTRAAGTQHKHNTHAARSMYTQCDQRTRAARSHNASTQHGHNAQATHAQQALSTDITRAHKAGTARNARTQYKHNTRAASTLHGQRALKAHPQSRYTRVADECAGAKRRESKRRHTQHRHRAHDATHKSLCTLTEGAWNEIQAVDVGVKLKMEDETYIK